MAARPKAGSRTVPGRRRRPVVGRLAAVVALAGTGLGLVSTGVSAAGGRTDPPATAGHPGWRPAGSKDAAGTGPTAVRALGLATGAAVPGTRSAYYEPLPATGVEAMSPAQFVVTGRDAPDPFVLVENGTDYLYTSQGNQTGNNIPVAAGRSLTTLGPLGDAMPALPAWAVPNFTWAPDVHRFGDHYVLYFTAIVASTDPADECIGIASGPSPLGPFIAEPQPFVCQLDQHGSIDPRTFTDVDGTTYLIWKSDDNADVNGTELTNIYSQPLSPDGLHLDGQPDPDLRARRALAGKDRRGPRPRLGPGGVLALLLRRVVQPAGLRHRRRPLRRPARAVCRLVRRAVPGLERPGSRAGRAIRLARRGRHLVALHAMAFGRPQLYNPAPAGGDAPARLRPGRAVRRRPHHRRPPADAPPGATARTARPPAGRCRAVTMTAGLRAG